jgi:hypothetical protein
MEGFNSLDLYHKSEILKQQANYLLTLETDKVSVKLYAWDRFLIEQYFDQESRVVKVCIAGNGEMIKYLKKINLADLGYPPVL